jgi:hemerythrin superfamily protein
MPNKIDELASSAMAAVKAAKATLKGLHGVFHTLAMQHGEVGALIHRARRSDETAARADLWHEIRRQLLAHERAEREVVYATLKEYPDTRPAADEHDREAEELETLIARVHALDPADPHWPAAVGGLEDRVTAHANAEENDIFPRAVEAMGRERAVLLDEQYLMANRRQLAGVKS